MNIDPKENTLQANKYLNLLESFSFKICNEHNTRESSNRRLDHLCTNFFENRQHKILTCPLTKDDVFRSDHSIIITLLDSRIRTNLRNTETYRVLDLWRIKISLRRDLHPNVLLDFNADEMGSYIVETICRITKENEKMKRKSISKSNACEWMDTQLENLIKKKDELKRKARQSLTQRNEADFNTISKEVTKAKHLAQTKHDNEIFKKSSDSKTTWKNVNQILGRNKKQSTEIDQLNTSEATYRDPNKIVNALNEHFLTIGSRTAEQISTRPYNDINFYNTLFYNYTTIEDEYANENEVLQIINKLKSGKSPGCDGITTSFLKRHRNSLVTPITMLFNQFM